MHGKMRVPLLSKTMFSANVANYLKIDKWLWTITELCFSHQDCMDMCAKWMITLVTWFSKKTFWSEDAPALIPFTSYNRTKKLFHLKMLLHWYHLQPDQNLHFVTQFMCTKFPSTQFTCEETRNGTVKTANPGQRAILLPATGICWCQ